MKPLIKRMRIKHEENFLKTIEISGGGIPSDDGHFLLVHVHDDGHCVVEIYNNGKGWVTSDHLDDVDSIVNWIASRDMPEDLCRFVGESYRDVFSGGV